jgi:penicillin-binding protein 1B
VLDDGLEVAVTRRSKSRRRRRVAGVRSAFKIGLLGAVAGMLAVVVIPRLFPLELPDLTEPSLIYARPHRIAVGQNIGSSGLVERLTRLGYRETKGEPKPGEFQRKKDRMILFRRAFQTAAASGPERRVELVLNKKGRIENIEDSNGGLLLEPDVIGELHTEKREFRDAVPLDEIPRVMVDAVITLEDRRFYDHGGLDLHRTAGAFFNNLQKGQISQGGSTITQQVVKNVYLDARKTYGRKIHEAWLALRVEAGQDKAKILETYLNTIYLGQRGAVSIRGVEAASRHYFGKSVRELSVAQCALLAGMIPAPGKFSPYNDEARAKEKRALVLRVLLEQGVITTEEYESANAEPLGALKKPPRPATAPYFTSWVERQITEALPDLDLRGSGYSVVTELDASLQILAEDAVQRGIANLEKGYPKLKRDKSPLQAALIALDPATGDVLAHVGGREYGATQFDRAIQSVRQPGSVFKPIVALAALSHDAEGNLPRFTLASRLEDSPLILKTGAGMWRPTNYDGEYRGIITLRRALERSLNIPMVRVAMDVGLERVVETGHKLGIQSKLDPVPSLALGSFEVSLLEVARAYAVFASGGVRVEPRFYTRVLDGEGQLLDSRRVKAERVFDASEIALVTSALQGTVERGTAVGVRSAGFRGPLAAKTGTTNDYRDAWFVGYTPDIVVAVWVGFDDQNDRVGLPGSVAALPIFVDFIKSALGPEGGRGFPMPDGLEYIPVQAETGLRASWGCVGDPELFLYGTAPVETCRPEYTGPEGERSPQVASRSDDEVRSAPRERPAPRRRPGLLRDIVDALGGIFGGR